MADADDIKGPQRFIVVVHRAWHEPQIRISVDDVGLSVSMTLLDFTKALYAELGASPESQKLCDAAVDRVVAGMKDATSRVM